MFSQDTGNRFLQRRSHIRPSIRSHHRHERIIGVRYDLPNLHDTEGAMSLLLFWNGTGAVSPVDIKRLGDNYGK